MEGGEDILCKTSPEKKADWLRVAMIRMDNLLDLPTRKAVREGCACRVGRQSSKVSQAVARDNVTLEARIAAMNITFIAFGGGVWMQDNGEIIVCFAPKDPEGYHCSCLPGAEKPLSVTYCYCCGGQLKHHFQLSLGLKLEANPRGTALSSGGKTPCTFSLGIKE
ncbi:MAG: hypothetical protein JXA17_02940 [Dehalococcoidales bacterium]|nr:hypothetical protein [Dehalococcoidales bacterium]